jgi:hypothetical protein
MQYVTSIVVALVVVAAAYYFLMSGASPVGEATDEQGAAAQSAVSRSGSGTFQDLASMSGSYECTISMTTDGATSQGQVYISDGEVRGDFSATVSGQSVSSSMLQTGGFVYTWSDMAPQGFKMAVTGDAGATAPTQGGFDPSMDVSYDCDPWVRDASKFAVPSDITFMEAPMVQ